MTTGHAEKNLFLHSWAMGLPCDRYMWPRDAYSNEVPGPSKESEKLVNNYQSTNTHGMQLRNWDMTMRLCFIFFRLISTQVLYQNMSEIAVYTFQIYTSLDLLTPGGWVEVCRRDRSCNLYLYLFCIIYHTSRSIPLPLVILIIRKGYAMCT
jgi:hypothetical protein